MITKPSDVPVYLHRLSVDFRKQINGLSLIVQESMLLDPYANALVVFCNRSRDRITLIYSAIAPCIALPPASLQSWQRNGFCLWMKRLEKDKFAWPIKSRTDAPVSITTQELHWLLEGFDIWRQPPHQSLHYRAVG